VKFDYVFVVAGYFTTETFDKLNPSEERKMIEICALAPLHLIQSLVVNGFLTKGSRVILITSEGGSIGLRIEREGGANYGHHMSKAAENMMGRLLAWDLKPKGL
jgi:NAD(P)-dependent dehydrogenase (short-subunit alcohol dehydrogenase family)